MNNITPTISAKHKILNIGSYLTMVMAMIIIVYAGYLLWWPFKVYENKSLVTDKIVYNVGDEIKFINDYCKFIPLEVTVNTRLVNDIIYQYSPIVRNAPVGCGKIQSEIRKIPDYAESGTYHIEVVLNYKVNFLRTINYTIESNQFHVVREVKQ